MNIDASLSRVHTITPMGDTATIKSAGGMNDKMKQSSPNVYDVDTEGAETRLRLERCRAVVRR